MVYYKTIAVLILSSNALLLNCKLTTEKIVGGLVADGTDYSYVVGIIGKYNKTYAHYLACNGGIISDFFILTHSECFMDGFGELMKLRFYVVLASVNLKDNFKAAQEIIFIYTYTENHGQNRYYLAILQLEDSLNLNINFHLKKLYLPRRDVEYSSEGKVAGYGFGSVDERRTRLITSRPRVSEYMDHPLRYANVSMISKHDCLKTYPYLDISREMCATMDRLPNLPIRGLCSYDEGAPLVVDDVVVGIAQKHRINCDNTVFGQLYTNVSYYLDFIYGVLYGNLTQGTVVQYNRIHLLDVEH